MGHCRFFRLRRTCGCQTPSDKTTGRGKAGQRWSVPRCRRACRRCRSSSVLLFLLSYMYPKTAGIQRDSQARFAVGTVASVTISEMLGKVEHLYGTQTLPLLL